MLIFITGGVRSGKSTYAEKVALQCRKKHSKLHYVATSVPYDEEMRERIDRHQADRSQYSVTFTTHEITTDIQNILGVFQDNDVVLVDCLTILLSNELFAGWESGKEVWREPRKRELIYDSLVDTFRRMKASNIVVIIVSNEICNDMLPNDESTFYYMQMLGSLHQQLVRICDQAVLVENGIPIMMKEVQGDEGNYVSRNFL